MAKIVHLYYEGPQSLIVELERVIEFGDVVDCPAEIAPKLLQAHGFSEATKAQVKAAASSATADQEKEPGAKEIVNGIPALSDQELQDLAIAESERPKSRVSVLNAIEAERESRTPPETTDADPEDDGSGTEGGEGA